MPRHFLRILDLDRETAWNVLRRALDIKREGRTDGVLSGKTVVLVFEKASTRTRVSFEVAVNDLGGTTLFMAGNDSQLGRSEPLRDTARVLSRYAHGLVVRTFGQANLEEMARYASIPVINALTDEYHPCQVMSDVLTLFERRPDLENLKVAWVGDGNNMAHSWINAAVHFPFGLALAAPKGYEPDRDVVENARRLGARLTLTHDPEEAVAGAHFVNTDVWASMGQESEHAARLDVFSPYQVNDSLLAGADPEACVMHCLPAHRGEEITNEVMESPRSIVWDQAENRMHMQKAILEWIFKENQ
ncbi:MAG: ornithine carbamoyltransferase [Thermodesulfobacteriota bacterium]|nr:ornithine carbamoyltransferase [Thermodesulfobacteriota bacterium]